MFESSPAPRGISLKLADQCPGYVGSHYFPDRPLGAEVDGVRNENLEKLTFGDNTFDLVVTLDVLEHVFDPERVMREIHRILRPGGSHIFTVPIHKTQVDPTRRRAALDSDGKLVHLEEPQYHGNPVSAEGSLVTYDYGYDIHSKLAEWGPFDVEIVRFARQSAGILGEYTEVVTCIRR